MGIQDLEHLFRIKAWIREYNNYFQTSFNFIIDTDTQKATRILINELGEYEIKRTLTRKEADSFRSRGFEMFVPDLMDIKRKIIIEYQEEPKPNKGYMMARITKKGHDEFSDLNKDEAYLRAGFRQLKLWESESDHDMKLKLFMFLSK